MPQGAKGSRSLRVAAEIRREMPDIIRRLIPVPQGLLVSITEVRVSPDLGQARIYFSVLGAHERRAAVTLERELNDKRGAIRSEIARRLVMRQHPELKFVFDETPARAARIESLLNQIQKASRPPQGGDDE